MPDEHLELGKHPERSYMTTLLKREGGFSLDLLRGDLQTEREDWMQYLRESSNTLTDFQKLEDVFSALRYESNALEAIESAMQYHARSLWSEASKQYCHAVNDFHFAVFQWTSAIGDIAKPTPFNHRSPSKEQRQRHDMPEPSVEEMWKASPYLFRIYRSLDRVTVLMQEMVQRQMTCLTNFMQEAEARQKKLRQDDEEEQR